MANGHGGYRRPEKPAAVSGPGKHSKRTDGGPGVSEKQAARYISGQDYGEGQVANEVARSAPLAAAGAVPGFTPLPEGFVGFDAESQYPDEPETAGFDYGPGSGYRPMDLSFDDDYADAGQGEVDPIAAIIRQAYVENPSEELLVLVEQLREQGR